MGLIKRDYYINWLISYRDKDLIKVITGLCGVGKSTLLGMFISYLKNIGIDDNHIVSINFDNLDNPSLFNGLKLHQYVLSHINGNEKVYVFLDEVQLLPNFETILNSLYTHKELDLYVTGSNAKFLSSEMATLLTGRSIEINVLPLSFKEYCDYYKESKKETRELFYDYITYGSLPGTLMFENDSLEQREYLENVYHTILEKDVIKRSKGSHLVADNIVKYLTYNAGISTTPRKITNALNTNQLKISYNTVTSYIDAINDTYLLYQCDRYDLVSKQYLTLINKYYLCDFGYQYYILNNQNVERAHLLENLIFLELKRRRYKVATGKINNLEVDFIIKDNYGQTKYIQVAVSVLDEDKLTQELRPLRKIKDFYPRFLITLDDCFVRDHDGIKVINALDFLLGKDDLTLM